jgi:NAD(P)-dependent dehydrogenase (short-subunit alcohol dehydrogenase family)
MTRVAIVTGATTGIGRAAALALGEGGWWVLASGRDAERGQAVALELAGRAGGEFVAGDVTAVGMPERLVERASAAGALDVLVNNAGIHFLATVADTSAQAYDSLMATNLRSAVLLSAAAIPVMRAGRGGVIVNVSSEAGIVAVPGQAAYNISKAGLLMLTRSIAVDHAQDGIRAVAVCPGTTRTALVDAAIESAPDPEAHERWLESARPAGRLGTPEEIAAAIAFVASDAASYMTGSELVIDGGYTAG